MPREMAEAQILEAAELEFGRSGFDGASMAGIARAAGLPKANLHYYFGTKEALYRAVLENTLTDWLADAELWLTPARAAREGLRGYVLAKLVFSRDRPHASRLFAHEMLQGAHHIRFYLSTTLRAHVALIGRTFALWAQRGQMHKVDTPHFMFALWAMTQAYADMSAQMAAVLDRPALLPEDFERGAATILGLLLNEPSLGMAAGETGAGTWMELREKN
ncbi:TetR/AcrR family transcriptional regulator [Acidomonas methanolica]|nr:TetR/AcrR family transcriptional regulator [Acidomonas methanolica]MBU2653663.1 TetR/AcrR family transcriptional regulator [Acidomonas methanolica]TCS31615.1 TetR family transcriptional regulator [Acidomonas methanolica]GBQ51720.1 TetR family transcriptional regulator [Acidomonas methanolica]